MRLHMMMTTVAVTGRVTLILRNRLTLGYEYEEHTQTTSRLLKGAPETGSAVMSAGPTIDHVGRGRMINYAQMALDPIRRISMLDVKKGPITVDHTRMVHATIVGPTNLRNTQKNGMMPDSTGIRPTDVRKTVDIRVMPDTANPGPADDRNTEILRPMPIAIIRRPSHLRLTVTKIGIVPAAIGSLPTNDGDALKVRMRPSTVTGPTYLGNTLLIVISTSAVNVGVPTNRNATDHLIRRIHGAVSNRAAILGLTFSGVRPNVTSLNGAIV